MSLINDALKQARKAPPRNVPTALTPLQPAAAKEPSVALTWLLPAVVIVLIVAAIFFIGWAVAHHTVRSTEAAGDATATQPAAPVPLPAVTPAPPPPPPVNPPDAPRLQGIFYSPTAPSAIIDGKNVKLGDRVGDNYRVKAISKYTVTLVGADKKEIQIGMGN
jgi:hypothetical protein